MKVVYFFRCLPFLMFVSGTSQGSEVKKLSPYVEEYLTKHPDSRSLFEGATPEKIELWEQRERRYEEFQERRKIIHAGFAEARKLTEQELQIHEQIKVYQAEIEKLKEERLKRSQDKIKNQPPEPFSAMGRWVTWNSEHSAYLDTDCWNCGLNVDFSTIFPSPREWHLQAQIDECYKLIKKVREEQKEKKRVLNQKNNELELDLQKFYAEIDIQYPPHLRPVQE